MKHLQKFEKFALRSWQQQQLDDILDRMSEPGYIPTVSDKAILDNYKNDNADVEAIVSRIREIKDEISKIEAEDYNDNADLETKKKFLIKLSPLRSELYGLEDDLLYIYKIDNPLDVGLDAYSD